MSHTDEKPTYHLMFLLSWQIKVYIRLPRGEKEKPRVFKDLLTKQHCFGEVGKLQVHGLITLSKSGFSSLDSLAYHQCIGISVL